MRLGYARGLGALAWWRAVVGVVVKFFFFLSFFPFFCFVCNVVWLATDS